MRRRRRREAPPTKTKERKERPIKKEDKEAPLDGCDRRKGEEQFQSAD
jgi:hypothetical protein